MAIPVNGVADQVIFGKHPVPAGLHAETAIMDPKDEVGTFTVATLELMEGDIDILTGGGGRCRW